MSYNQTTTSLDKIPDNKLLFMGHKSKCNKLRSKGKSFYILVKEKRPIINKKYSSKGRNLKKRYFFVTEEIKKYFKQHNYMILTNGNEYLCFNNKFLIPESIFKKLQNVNSKKEKVPFAIKNGNDILLIDMYRIDELSSIISKDIETLGISSELKKLRISKQASEYGILLNEANNQILAYLKENS
jgi:hypothetical protein